MRMSARCVRMAVREFFFGGIAYVDDIDVEYQRFAGQRMIGIDIDIEFTDFDDRHIPWSILGVDRNHLPGFELFVFAGEMLDRDTLRLTRLTQSVGLFGR
jgi:hypothetical protein